MGLIKKITFFVLNFLILFNSYADEDKPCGGTYGFIDLINRPSFANSACTVANKKRVVESGYSHLKLIGSGNAQLFPLTELRLGLPANTEIFSLLPTYVTETVFPRSGFGPASFGMKHVLFSKGNNMITGYGYVRPPSGSRNFGTTRWGGYLSTIVAYELTKKLGLVGEFILTTTTEPAINGGQRYSSFNPDFLLVYKPVDSIELFAEFHGESKTGYGQGSGFIAHLGFIYLVKKNWTIDLDVGQRIYGLILNVERFVGAGTAIRF